MSLDSVELIVNFEKHFQISIPDKEAEKIATVKDMIDCAVSKLNISNNSTELQTQIIQKINQSLLYLNIIERPLESEAKIFQLLEPQQEEVWTRLSKKLLLKLPKPHTGKHNSGRKIMGFLSYNPNYNYRELTLIDFADAICAENYKALIKNNAPKSIYEIYISVKVITSDSCGVDLYEILPHKSFTNDFGID